MKQWLNRFVLDPGREVVAGLVAEGEGHLPEAEKSTACHDAHGASSRNDPLGAPRRRRYQYFQFDATITRWFLEQGGRCGRHVVAQQSDREAL